MQHAPLYPDCEAMLSREQEQASHVESIRAVNIEGDALHVIGIRLAADNRVLRFAAASRVHNHRFPKFEP